ncbi:MAG: DNA repair protein RadA [Acidimicrobiia bacterium]|nr:DNA repair protein RadA [Acidimicrobiia bacterium]
MAKTRTVFTCQDCGHHSPRWQGRCSGCGAWNTLVEERSASFSTTSATDQPLVPAVPVTELAADELSAEPTGIDEVDRVLSGGLVPGSVTLLGGEPGIGKSTLLLQIAASVADNGHRVLYLSGEESPEQIRLRAERLGALHPRLWLAPALTIGELAAHLAAVKPDLVLIDSIQTLHDPSLSSAPGSVAQIRECTAAIVAEAKASGVATILVGHVTKDGALAGPRVLEHLVDTVLSFDGDRSHGLRLLQAHKHRFGTTAELGVFEMSDRGLTAVADPSQLFLADRRPGVAGTMVVPTLEGRRPLLVEVQALVQRSNLPTPRRSAQGFDTTRLGLLLAVLSQQCRLPDLPSADVFAMVVGGVRISEPGADLGLVMAVVSSVANAPLPPGLVAVGEVGLAGEVRQVAHCEQRLREAARLGFRKAVVPASYEGSNAGMAIKRVATVPDAIRAGFPEYYPDTDVGTATMATPAELLD